MQRIVRLVTTLSAATASLAILAAAANAQGDNRAYKREIPARLGARAKVSEDSAATIARGKVPNGRIQSVELEEEKGRLIYSYDIKIPGKSGIEEVNVSAADGSVIAVEHESPATEKKEAADEKKAAARNRAKKPAPR
jgi:uncharacterized membrane protein YkoI